jgi:flagellar hook-associated protein 1 FlgK
MDLVSVMMNAGAGLGVFRAQVATASHNIANANTPAYARQDAVATETIPSEEIGTNGYIGRGVSLQGVVQNRDQFIETQLSTAFGNSASSSAQSDALSTVTALDPQQQGGITDAVGKFYSSLRDLNQNPGDVGLRQTVVDSAQSLAKAFNVTATSLASCRSGIDQNVSALLDKANGLLASVADLNRKIALAVNSGRNPNDLLDVRQNGLDQLAQMLGTRAVPDDHSNVSVVLPDGTALVSGAVAAKLSTQANTANSGHLDVVFTPLDGSMSTVLNASDMSGQIGGLLSARDKVLGAAQSSLDTLAYDFATTVNTQHEQGYALDGSTGHDLFAALPGSADAAATIAVDPTTYANPSLIAAAGNPPTNTTGGPGDSTNLQAIIGTESTKLSTGLNVQDGMAKLTSDFGIAVSSASDSTEFDKNLLTDLTNARESASGVSVDDELTKLMQAQTSYNALTKVVTTTNTLLDTLMKMF